MTERSERDLAARRRGVLASIGLLAGARTSAMVGGVRTDARRAYTLVQGGRCIPVTPLSGSEPVEAVYDYRLPARYVSEENGARTGSRPYFSSVGTRGLQRADTSLLFLYDGPSGVSLVVVHGRVGDASSGGSATFRVEGLPSDGRWVVKDDLYRDPDTGRIETTNYDRWAVDGSVHTVDWTWGANTDGGAFRGIGTGPTVTVDPAFNEAAALFGEHYEGTVAEWHLLTADGDGLRRVPLDMVTPVAIRPGDCSTAGGTPSPGDAPTDGRNREERTETEERGRNERTKHEKKREKHQRQQQKHEKKRAKHEKERRRRKHERQRRKHRKQRTKHEKQQRKHRRQREKHRKQRRKHRRQRKKHERKKEKHEN